MKLAQCVYCGCSNEKKCSHHQCSCIIYKNFHPSPILELKKSVLTITSFHHCFQLIAENSPDPPDAVEKHQNQNSDNDHSPDNRHLNNGGFTAVSSNTAVSPNNGEY